MTRRHLLIGAIALAGLALVLVKPAMMRADGTEKLLVLWRWQSGTIGFVNSVTGKPVAISFKINGLFQDFNVTTDQTTEAYYTSGLYTMNGAVSTEATDILRFCSVKGISLTLGGYGFHIKDGCLEVKLLWTM